MGERQTAAGARFGEAPLEQTVAAAGAIRRLGGLLLSLEHPHPAVDAIVARIAEWEAELGAVLPPDSSPRIGADDSGTHRVYLDHATDIGAFNPCFPEYRFDRLDGDFASGTVAFPLVYEGPPGLVHGGFLSVFFDSVIQHQNCVTGLSGKTRSLQVTFRRPTPLQTELRFDISRVQEERGITSTARLLLGEEVLCVGEVTTLALPPEKLTGHRLGKRRVEQA
ncbi:hypothetical protein PT015_09425 [Candidatus Mycobacterium wuenschmannii]|uniref:Thioesterase n=1 Tax=Candidatus Mycobacterium wuenschmannii TaxID=3027808 RepID=A0ABY8W183_9MYCO|nr:hypothetical protein [Candidatus Mycobacterium wuenschmannii]WIM89623.1 hypothetical protein PT015_09425 [Candidatus Mycobacterium wuenschmannii]